MGLFVKKNHEKEYLYSLAGKEQFFLGRKDDPDNLNQGNLNKAIKIIDENFDNQLKKYLMDFDEHVSYMMENKKKIYVKNRNAKLLLTLKINDRHVNRGD